MMQLAMIVAVVAVIAIAAALYQTHEEGLW
jgi:hypothetical protein